MSPFVTFIIPTTGRQTLKRTISSLLKQGDSDWAAVIVGDCVADAELRKFFVTDSRVMFFNSPEKLGHDNVGAEVRNFGLYRIDRFENHPQWIASLDDDDTVTPDYVGRLKKESPGMDLIQFRALWENGIDIRPEIGEKRLLARTVCNAFAFRYEFAWLHELRFVDGTSEDWATISAFIAAGAETKISEYVTYQVRR